MRKWITGILALACCIVAVACNGGDELQMPSDNGSENSSVTLENGSEESVPFLKITVYYDLGELKGDAYAYVEKADEEVSVGEQFIPQTPVCYGYKFNGWQTEDGQPIGSTVYAANGNIRLVATWEKDENSDRWMNYSPFIKQ